MRNRERRRVQRDRLPSEEAVTCNCCGKPIPPRSIRPGRALCARCRTQQGQVFYRNRGSDIPPRPEHTPLGETYEQKLKRLRDRERIGPVYELTPEEAEAAEARWRAHEEALDRALHVGPPGDPARPGRASRQYETPAPAPRIPHEVSRERGRRGNPPSKPRDLKPRAERTEQVIRRARRGLPPETKAEARAIADVQELARRRAAFARRQRPAGITDEQWEALSLVEGEGLSLQQAADRLGIGKSTVQDRLQKARKHLP